MKRTLTTTLTAALLLVGCSSSPNDASPNFEPQSTTEATPAEETTPAKEPVTEEPETEEPTPEQNFSDRGSLILEEGEEGGVDTHDGEELLTFVVNSIEVDPECTGDRVMDPENGHFVALDVEITSTASAAEYYVEPSMLFNKASMRIIDNDGATRSESPNSTPSFECLTDGEQLPSDFGPGEKVTGKVVLDVPVESGIILTDLSIGEDLQWEWEY